MSADSKLIKGLSELPSSTRLFIAFPYAGAGASFYYRWQSFLKDVCNVCPVQLPGREERLGEHFYKNIEMVAEDVAEILSHLDHSLILYGHSMGAKIVYEVEKRLENRGKIADLIIVSGCQNPSEPDRECIAGLPDVDFIEKLIQYNGIAPELAENHEVLNFFLPTLKADFSLSESYQCHDLHQLKAPIRAMGGFEDREANESIIKRWEAVNPKDFDFKMFEGSHFFIRENENVIKQIREWIEQCR